MRFSVPGLTTKLQTLRAAHALAEAGGTLCVADAEAPILTYLATRLPIDWIVADAPSIPIEIDHALPRTALGTVERALLFPHAAVERCHATWRTRDRRFSFVGLMTPSRYRVLGDWSERVGGRRLREPGRLGRRRTNAPLRGTPPGVEMWASDRGRTYPVKAWDDAYFEVLGRSQFVLCPAGDFTWTYRVFESALCGAIPVVEAGSDAYGELLVRSLDDDPRTLQWDAEVADHNRRVAAELVTAPHVELAAALGTALGAP